jgi:hypothetical protein
VVVVKCAKERGEGEKEKLVETRTTHMMVRTTAAASTTKKNQKNVPDII